MVLAAAEKRGWGIEAGLPTATTFKPERQCDQGDIHERGKACLPWQSHGIGVAHLPWKI